MWQRNDWIVILTLPVSTIVFFLGYMNKFGLCLVDKEIINSSFISTVGNINWYCGYLVTVLFGGVYLLWWMGSEITWKRALLMGYVTIGFASLVTQGSSSGVVTLAVMLFVLFGMSVKDGGKMECLWQEMTLLSVSCLITYILRSCNVLSQELPMEKVTDILTFSAMSVIMTIVSVVVLWLVHTSNNRNHYRGKLFWGIYRILCVALPVVSVALLAFILANTLLGGKLTSFLTETAGDGGSNWLMFSAAWGSNRGATWSAGARCFWEADLLHKIFGVGPDCMYAFLSNEASPELQNMVYDFFYGNRLTNAHNEWLTILVI